MELQKKIEDIICDFVFNSYPFTKEVTSTTGHSLDRYNAKLTAKECTKLCLKEQIKLLRKLREDVLFDIKDKPELLKEILKLQQQLDKLEDENLE